MSARTRLFGRRDPYDQDGTAKLFVKAMRENCAYHFRKCPEYRRILEGEGFDPESVQSPEDLMKIPFVPTLLYKETRMISKPFPIPGISSTSSGTGGKKTFMRLSVGDLWCGLWMCLRTAKKRGILSPKPCHYVVLGYKPGTGNKLGAAKSAFGATFFAPALSRRYALIYRNGAYVPALEELLERVKKLESARFPTRFMGFPAYAFFLMRLMEEKGVSVRLPKGSLMMLAGGWKQFYTQQISKPEFYDLARRTLGIPEDGIVEFFGAVEHPVMYCDCPEHRFHVPIYSRAFVRDPYTLEPAGYGRPGLLQLMTPMVKATPLSCVMTDDLAVMRDGADCPCGIKTPYIELLGRAGLADVKTCAAEAAKTLREVKL